MTIVGDKNFWAIQGLTAEIRDTQRRYDELVINDKSNREKNRLYRHIQSLGRLRNQYKAEQQKSYSQK